MATNNITFNGIEVSKNNVTTDEQFTLKVFVYTSREEPGDNYLPFKLGNTDKVKIQE